MGDKNNVFSASEHKGKFRRILLIGVKGIGKTTILNKILPDLPQLLFIPGSGGLKEIVGATFDNFERFPLEKKSEYRNKLTEYWKSIQERNGKHVIIDGHTILHMAHNNMMENILTHENCMFFTDFVYMNAKPEVILERRKNDLIKKRNTDLETIRKEIEAEWEETHRIVRTYGQNIYYLEDPGNVDVSGELKQILNRIISS